VAQASAKETFEVFEPALGTVLAHVPETGAAGIDTAVQAATAAAPGWRALGPIGRAEVVRRFAGSVREHVDELALLDSRNGGFRLAAARMGALKGSQSLEFFAGLAPTIGGSTIPASTDHLHYTVREPFGVVGVITAFNHPTLFATARTAAALVAGNCVLVKPASHTPLSAIRLAELAREHFPPGVFNVVPGRAGTGTALVTHPLIRRIGFTGSVDTALKIQALAAESGTIKRLSFQLGGKNPLIVLPDADLDRAADAAVEGMNLANVVGQSCGSTSRAFVHRSVHDAFVEQVAARFSAIQFGFPQDESAGLGPLISDAHRQSVEQYVEIGRREGARLVTGGERGRPPFDAGFYYRPTLFDRVDSSKRLGREEIFGPVLSVIEWTDEDDMVGAVNDVRFGLTASIFTRDLVTAHRLAARVESGYVWVNTVERRWIGVPFGGFKDSGTSTEYSADELSAFSLIKSVNISLQ
jgi:acyl-CoA reductase-like NAD-dependent aldehyde dehydrogenase